ncbi:MAG: DNA-binding response regulator [Saprospiraceae bacterium]|nr:MAG: DNA-binding response regulator [Saprospiraceae bacterium]
MAQLKQKILLVDNDSDATTPLRRYLEDEHFLVSTAKSGEAAIEYLSNAIPDVIILEIVLPGLDGVEVCRHLRAMPLMNNTIIIFLTDRGEDYSEIAAFEAGADDYIVKPRRPRVLLPRLKALLKRKSPADNNRSVTKPSLSIDRDRMIAYKNGQMIHWRNKEFKLLYLLSSEAGKVFTRKEILNNIWGSVDTSNERIIDVYVRRIRKKIGPDHIITIIGHGYKFVF